MAAPGDTTRVSVSTAGVQADGPSGDWAHPAIDADGSIIAWDATATNLVDGDDNGARDVFVRDRSTGKTTRVSVATDGTEADGRSRSPAISDDGRYISFVSDADNLVPGDTNGVADVFVHDRQTGATTRASVDSGGRQAGSTSDSGPLAVAISGDGRFVEFDSWASDLVPDDTNNTADVFVHDLRDDRTERVSVAADGSQLSGQSEIGGLSRDGSVAAFASYSMHFSPGWPFDGRDPSSYYDVFARDRAAQTTDMMSVSSEGTPGDANSVLPAISGDGRFVSFTSEATNLVAGETDRTDDVFVHDRVNGKTELVNVSDGTPSSGTGTYSSISADGRYVSYYDYWGHAVVRDRQEETTSVAGTIWPSVPSISADGSTVAFASDAEDLVEGDTNGALDVFVHELPRAATSVTQTVGASGGTVDYAAAPSPAAPVVASVTTPVAATVTIDQTDDSTYGAPRGYELLGAHYDITITDMDGPVNTASTGQPLSLAFKIDPSAFAPGGDAALAGVTMVRDGLALADCAGRLLDRSDLDDACVADRKIDHDTGVGTITVSSWHASDWSAARMTDTTAPSIAFAGDRTYTVDETVAVTCTASDEADGSGLAGDPCAAPVTSGEAWTFNLGGHAAGPVTAADQAGNTTTRSASFTVKVTPSSLSRLTERFIRSSPKVRALAPGLQTAAVKVAASAGQKLDVIVAGLPAKKEAAAITAYKHEVSGLVAPGWLTSTQAGTLQRLADAL